MCQIISRIYYIFDGIIPKHKTNRTVCILVLLHIQSGTISWEQNSWARINSRDERKMKNNMRNILLFIVIVVIGLLSEWMKQASERVKAKTQHIQSWDLILSRLLIRPFFRIIILSATLNITKQQRACYYVFVIQWKIMTMDCRSVHANTSLSNSKHA